MANIHRLPNERRVLEEASEWMARLLSDEVTAEEWTRFEAWRSAHPLHRRTYDELNETQGRFVAARSLVNAVAFGQSMTETAALAEARATRERIRRHRAAWAAAIVGLVVGLGLFSYLHERPGRTYATASGEHATVLLPDGSTLELDGNSRARVEFSTRYRIVDLEQGEALFKVIHNAQRPFWVVGGGSWVRDVGTIFNVQLNANGIRVTVSAGTVKVGAIGPLLREIPFQAILFHETALSVLTAGHQAELSGTAVNVRPLTRAQLASAISWHAQTLYFENAPLSEVAKELGRYTRLNIIVSDRGLQQLPIAGTFEASPQGVETFLTMLNQGLGLAVHSEAGKVFILPADSTAH